MHHHYEDLRKLLGEPVWFDEHAVPRYCDFSPDMTADIYADEAVLLRIACQSCDRPFDVAMTGSAGVLAAQIADGSIHFGDPPNVGCCLSGPSMNCIDLRVLQYWTRANPLHVWRRDETKERELPGEMCEAIEDTPARTT